MDELLEMRKNINRGYRKLRAWRKAVELYALVSEVVKEIQGHPYTLVSQILSAASSISANIAEGYCRRSLKEYLNFLNIALGSSGELYTRCYASYLAQQISRQTFERFDLAHYDAENHLLELIKGLQQKQLEGGWQDSFVLREDDALYFVSEKESDDQSI
jgi:four helix bundle protein